MDIEIIYEDEALLAVNKPAFLPVHATQDPLRVHLQGKIEAQTGRPLVLFHRLDVDTTGVVLFGKDPTINRQVTEMFRDRKIEKSYWAVVDGRWLPEWTEVTTYICKRGGGRWENRPKGSGGDLAESRFKILASNGDKSWLEVRPMTGRTHQIRLHCTEKRHPVLGDRLYGHPDPRGLPMALHAARLSLLHPVTNKRIEISATAPDYWKEHWLKGIR